MKDKAQIYNEKIEKGVITSLNSLHRKLNKSIEKEILKLEVIFMKAKNSDDFNSFIRKAHPQIKSLCKSISQKLAIFNNEAMQIIDSVLFDVYGYNFDYTTYKIIVESLLNYSRPITPSKIKNALQSIIGSYNDILKDINKNTIYNTIELEKAINRVANNQMSSNVIKQSIIKFSKKQLDNLFTNLALQIGSTSNKANFDSMVQAQEYGLNIEKQWLSTFDSRTRPSHQSLANEVVPLNKPFKNGLMYPCDKNGSVKEYIRCRCTIATEFKGFNKKELEKKLDKDLSNLKFEVWRDSK